MPSSQANTKNAIAESSRSMTATDEMRVFISDKNITTIVCPKCNNSVTRNLGDVRRIQKAIRIKCQCSCGHEYKVLLERRKHFRKQTNLGGRYLFQSENGNVKKGLIRVLDISQTGLKFKTNSKPELAPGDEIAIEFFLNDKAGSKIEKDCVVKRVKGFRVGVAFLTTDHYGPLGSYLMR